MSQYSPTRALGLLGESVGEGAVGRTRRAFSNLRAVAALFPMLVVSCRHGPGRRWLEWWGYFLGQLGKETGRSLIPILALGMGFGLGIGTVTGGPSSLVGAALATRDAVPTILRVGLPLALAVFFAARTGGPLAAKFSQAVQEADGEWGPRVLAWDVWPHLWTAIITGVIAYVLAAEFLVRGYEAAGDARTYVALDGVKLTGWGDAALRGMIVTAVLSYLASHVAIAYGAAHGREAAGRDPRVRPQPDHYVIWQSFRTSVVLAFLLTLIL